MRKGYFFKCKVKHFKHSLRWKISLSKIETRKYGVLYRLPLVAV